MKQLTNKERVSDYESTKQSLIRGKEMFMTNNQKIENTRRYEVAYFLWMNGELYHHNSRMVDWLDEMVELGYRLHTFLDTKDKSVAIVELENLSKEVNDE